ncbi:MAG TPA: hypothetical protein VNH15_05300 [Elusimicrobiota bacterium]|jgi:hypothetical protein|nr:hypothetical protein [Elusimicrobiota bacterium]
MKRFLALLASAAALAILPGCGQSSLDYTPNFPLAKRAPRFPIKAALMPLRDLTPYGPPPADQSAVELTASGDGNCPKLSPKNLTRDLARDIAAGGLVRSVEVVQDEWQAVQDGDKLLIVGQIEDASDADAGSGTAGRKAGKKSLNLDVEIRALMRYDASEPFSDQIWEQDLRVQETVPSPLEPAAVSEALRRLYLKIDKNIEDALRDQAKFARLAPKTPPIANPAVPGV